MRIIEEKKQSKVSFKKYILPEGVEFKCGKYILEKNDAIYFAVKEEGDGRKGNIENFGDKKAEPFTADDAEKAKEKKEEEASMDSDYQNVEDDDVGIQEKCKREEEVEVEIEDNENAKEMSEEVDDNDMEDEEEKPKVKAIDKVEESKKRMKKVSITENNSGSRKKSLFSGLTESSKWK